jgi:hypothetical protein
MQKNEKKQERSSIYSLCKYTLMTCALMAAGCAPQTSAPLRVKVQGSVLYVEQDQGIGTADLMEVAEDVLANMYFTIDKADADSGLIRTRPLPGGQFFEFWRSDNAGTDNALAANLHTIRRTVTLDISQEGQELRIGCNVQAQRLSLPERQVSSSTTRVYGMFSQSSQSLQKLKLNPEQKKEMAWIDLDRDSRLEAEILKRIETGIVRLSNHQSQMTENQT